MSGKELRLTRNQVIGESVVLILGLALVFSVSRLSVIWLGLV